MRIIAIAVAASVAAGCGSSNNVSLSARAGGLAAATRSPGSTELTVGNGIAVSRVRMVVRRIKLKAEGSSADAGSSDAGTSSGDERELKVGPFLIDLSGSALEAGTAQKIFDAEVPAGTYRKLKFKIHKLEDNDAVGDSRFDELRKLSIVVDGTVDGKAFKFTSALDEEQEREGTFTVGSATNNITLTVDPTKWFVGSSGQRLDPSDPSVDRSKIEQNIKASLDAYDDDDKDGRKD